RGDGLRLCGECIEHAKSRSANRAGGHLRYIATILAVGHNGIGHSGDLASFAEYDPLPLVVTRTALAAYRSIGLHLNVQVRTCCRQIHSVIGGATAKHSTSRWTKVHGRSGVVREEDRAGIAGSIVDAD